MNLREFQGGDKRNSVTRHLHHRIRRCPGGAADAGVVEGDHPPGRRKGVN
jgi:hypothetical protein